MKPVDTSDSLVRPAGNRSKKPKMIIFSEGYVTEVGYFRALRDWVRSGRCDVLADVVVMQRYVLQIGHSDPIRIVKLTDDYIRMIKTGIYSKTLFIGKVLESMYSADAAESISEKELSKEVESVLRDNGHLDGNGHIRVQSRAMGDVRKMLESKFSIESFESIHDEIDYDEEIDRICIVVDRDIDCRSGEKYRQFVDGCKERGYLPFVTNPRFELWLILHYDVSDYIESLKAPLKYKSTIKRLEEKFAIDDKVIDYSRIIPLIPFAVEQVKQLCTDVSCLERETGSNLGDLMMMLGIGGS